MDKSHSYPRYPENLFPYSRHTLIPVSYTHLDVYKRQSLGIYTYTISQKAGTNKLASYDDSVYNLVIYVTNAETGEGFETTVLLYKTGNTNKFEEADFYNEYEEIVIIEDEDPPLGPVIIEDEETPIGPAKLPKTGEVSSELFLLIGAIVVTTGVVLKKKNA